jgi:hypothetical protein
LSFLAVFVLAGAARIEAWPLTGWRLFSQQRAAQQVGWEAAGVDAEGVERPIPFGRLSHAYRGFVHVLTGFESLSPGRRQEVCEAWASAVAGLGAPVSEIRVYRVSADVSRRQGRRAAPPSARELRYVCPIEGSPRAAS